MAKNTRRRRKEDKGQKKLFTEYPHRNHGLFSDYFLNELVPQLPQWAVDSVEVGEVRDRVKAVYEHHKGSLPDVDEASLEEHFIRPVLRELGHVFDVQCNTPAGGHPDYAFFPDDDTMGKALGKAHRPYLAKVIAVGDAKRWRRSLDKKDANEKDSFQRNNPSWQIDWYLRDTSKAWGILTNGELWRIYNSRTSHKLDSFYEINLPALLKPSESVESFKYFYLFFRREAFVPDPRAFLDDVFAKSIEFATGISDSLKENVFSALSQLCEGFIRHPPNQLDSTRDLKEVYDNSLILLYRLLFILYAESRDLLPLSYRAYREGKSLQNIREGIAPRIDAGFDSDDELSAEFWPRLQELFALIDEGDPRHLKVPAYNGGLFRQDAPEHRILETKVVPDKWLLPAIDLLARAEPRKGTERVFVVYRDLQPQHLGTIYEGLLEHKPRFIDEDAVEVEIKPGVLKYMPKGEPLPKGKRVRREISANSVVLETHKGERRITGSYYTPAYIVNYIVEKAIDTLCDSINDHLQQEITECEKMAKAAPAAVEDTIRNEAKQRLEKLRGDYDDRVLELKILDPAMGSGHFLVEAVDRLAWQIATNPNSSDEEAPGNETDIAFWRRKVVERCIFGVDLNPLAVELAKVSLWLTTVQKDKALSFLDHHLKCGNSVVGAWMAQMDQLPPSTGKGKKKTTGQLSQSLLGFFSNRFIEQVEPLLAAYQEIEARPTDTRQEAKRKEKTFRERVQRKVRRFIEVMHLHTAPYFGHNVGAKFADVLQALTQPEEKWEAIGQESWFADAIKLGDAREFFHWELEFPEAFFGKSGQRAIGEQGFDCVIGNPPYVRQEALGEFKPYFAQAFEAFQGTADIYVCFINLAHKLLKDGGQFGFICCNKFMRASYGKELRRYLRENAYIKEIVDFGELRVFEEAATFPAIILTEKGREHEPPPTRYAPIRELQEGANGWLEKAVRQSAREVPSSAFEGYNWSLVGEEENAILRKMKEAGLPLHQYPEVRMRRGVLTGLNEALVIDRATRDQLIKVDPVSGEIIKPLIVGDDVRKYEINYRERYLIWTYIGVDISKYPGILKHLAAYKGPMEKRWDKGDHWYELRACDYYADFDKPKIVYPIIAKESRFAFDDGRHFTNDKTFLIPRKDFYLLALLNSKVSWLFLKRLCSILGDPDKAGRLELREIHLRQLPIRAISFTTCEGTRKRDVNALLRSFKESDFDGVVKGVGECLPLDANGNPIKDREKSDVVHDLLSHIAKEIVDANRERQSEEKKLLDWMNQQLNLDVHSLRLVGNMTEYWEAGFQRLSGKLKSKKVRLHGDGPTRLRAEFENRQDKAISLLAKAKSTEKLIDRIVYRLYGLNEKQIAIVERGG